ncbi:MAG: hypothetical protein ACW98A_07610 [Candidatus Hodarchaeales archaeon]
MSFSELRALGENGYFEEYLRRFDELQAADNLALFSAEEQCVLMTWKIWILNLYFRWNSSRSKTSICFSEITSKRTRIYSSSGSAL